MLVIKLGGSLLNLPNLHERLLNFLHALYTSTWLIVPGGGASADVIRDLDRTHHLSEAAHWLALRACTLNAHLLHHWLPHAPLVSEPVGFRGQGILDPFTFCQRDEGQPDALPHTWEATSDSVAARVAGLAQADLLLLKSIALPPPIDWDEAARAGHVDPLFPHLVRRDRLRVRVINLRPRLDQAD
ncbi:MAG: hypothetical protein U0840_18760 [Gemmataceae bacterium]